MDTTISSRTSNSAPECPDRYCQLQGSGYVGSVTNSCLSCSRTCRVTLWFILDYAPWAQSKVPSDTASADARSCESRRHAMPAPGHVAREDKKHLVQGTTHARSDESCHCEVSLHQSESNVPLRLLVTPGVAVSRSSSEASSQHRRFLSSLVRLRSFTRTTRTMY